MVALFTLLADDDKWLRLSLAAFGIVAVILVGAGLIELAKRWRKRPFRSRISASEQLAQFREQFEKGLIKPEEFERIRALLNERIRQEMEVSTASAVPAPEVKPDGLNPDNPRNDLPP
jgi:hypothetical protein